MNPGFHVTLRSILSKQAAGYDPRPLQDNSSTSSHTENVFLEQIPRCQALKITAAYITDILRVQQ